MVLGPNSYAKLIKKDSLSNMNWDLNDELPDAKLPWWDNHYEGTYSDDPEDGYPYDLGTKVQG